MTENLLLQAALGYAELGYPVFPCAPGTKKPLTEHGFHDATQDPEQIEAWWQQHPAANIAIPTQGLAVIDIDGKGNTWLKEAPDKLLDLARVPISITPRGGRHYIFRQPPERHWRSTTKKLASSVDTRADGGYIVVPPSMVTGQRAYCWAEGMALDTPLPQLPTPPAWLIEELDRLAATSPTLAPVAAGSGDANKIPSGQRNATLASLAGTMRRAGMGQQEILAALRATNELRCQPPLPEHEVEQITASIARYAPDQITVALVENHWAQNHEEDCEMSDTPLNPGPFPDSLLTVPGFIAEVVDFNLTGAFKPQPVLALGAAIALVGTLTGRKVTDPYNTRTNVYCLGVCASGGGKERARQVNKEILFQAGLDKLVGPEGVASHAGLISAVEVSPTLLFQLDEIGRILKTLGDASRSPHLYHVATVLMKLYTSSSSVYLGDAYADTKRNKSIDQPNVCIWGTSVPKSLYEGLTHESITDGFLSRMFVFEGEDNIPKQRRASLPLPPTIIETARWWGDFQTSGNLRQEHPEPMIVTASTEAEVLFDQMDQWADKQSIELGEPLGALWTRTTEKARKLALLYACSANHQSPTINLEAAKWGCTLSEYLTRRMIYLANQWVAESPFDAKRKRVLRIIRRAGPGGISRSALCRSTRAIPARERGEIIEALRVCGDIRDFEEKTGGAPRLRYVAQ